MYIHFFLFKNSRRGAGRGQISKLSIFTYIPLQGGGGFNVARVEITSIKVQN